MRDQDRDAMPGASGGEPDRTNAQGRVAGIRKLLGELRDQVPEVSGAEASELLALATELTAEIEALRLTLISRVEECGVWRVDPNATMNSWLRSHHGEDHTQAQADVAAARALREFPSLRAAAEAGKISRRHTDVILSIGQANPLRSMQLREFMPIFVGLAETASVATLRQVMRRWADQVDPIGTAGEERDAHSRRYLHISTVGDGVKLDGFFGHEQGALIRVALNAALTAQRRKHRESYLADAARVGIARDDGSALVNATAAQRADAFVSGIIDPVASGDILPTSGGSRAVVSVLVPIDRLERPCNEARDTTDVKSALSLTSEIGDREQRRLLELGSAKIRVTNGPGEALISAQAAQRITCDCEIHRIVISPEGLPLDVGRTMRSFPPQMRKALVVRDGGCVFPGCDRPPGWSEAHHIVHWARGGKTSLKNAVLLCTNHHHQVHANGHEVDIGPNGRGRVTLKQIVMRR